MTSRSSLGPLNIGNVVTTGFTLFKSNFLNFFKLSGWAYLWVLVPVYGWAKFAMYQGLMARLAFGQLVNQPETIEEARNSIKDRLWTLWIAGILVALIAGGIYAAFIIVLIVGGIVVGFAAASLGPVGVVVGVILGLIAVLALLIALTWISGRLFVTEMPIAIEPNNLDPGAALGQSWRLTQAEARRVMVIVFIAALITFPLTLVVQIVSQVPAVAIAADSPLQAADSPLQSVVFLLSLALSIAAGMVTLPFWQCIKAATYYDLRSRKEGLDIQLRDRPL